MIGRLANDFWEGSGGMVWDNLDTMLCRASQGMGDREWHNHSFMGV